MTPKERLNYYLETAIDGLDAVIYGLDQLEEGITLVDTVEQIKDTINVLNTIQCQLDGLTED